MKPTNPMAQLEQWKANNAPKIGLVNQSKTGSVKNSDALKFEESLKTQQEAQGATKERLPFTLWWWNIAK
ncbi:hypothetical protein CF65_00784 [Aggregatibacter actinomycetemcomitans HK1651]|nr:hypothetical protein [Aggregatibacter actinomycetemcomitans]AHN71288.1 hypothetical protein CF65_00784 [Aggregatibacter actinomycetemcomitans HK1651]